MWQLGSRQPQPAGLRPTWQRKDALPQRDESGMEERKSTLCRAPGHTAGVKGIKQTDIAAFLAAGCRKVLGQSCKGVRWERLLRTLNLLRLRATLFGVTAG